MDWEMLNNRGVCSRCGAKGTGADRDVVVKYCCAVHETPICERCQPFVKSQHTGTRRERRAKK
jgi:hypothetical protein